MKAKTKSFIFLTVAITGLLLIAQLACQENDSKLSTGSATAQSDALINVRDSYHIITATNISELQKKVNRIIKRHTNYFPIGGVSVFPPVSNELGEPSTNIYGQVLLKRSSNID